MPRILTPMIMYCLWQFLTCKVKSLEIHHVEVSQNNFSRCTTNLILDFAISLIHNAILHQKHLLSNMNNQNTKYIRRTRTSSDRLP